LSVHATVASVANDLVYERDIGDLPDNVHDAMDFTPEAVRMCLSDLSRVLRAEAKQAYRIRKRGNIIIPVVARVKLLARLNENVWSH